jgi:hypothetical protein
VRIKRKQRIAFNDHRRVWDVTHTRSVGTRRTWSSWQLGIQRNSAINKMLSVFLKMPIQLTTTVLNQLTTTVLNEVFCHSYFASLLPMMLCVVINGILNRIF